MQSPMLAVLRSLVLACTTLGVAATALADPQAQTLDMAAFDRIKTLDGRWQGTAGEDGGPPVTLDVRVTSNGRAVVATEFAGSPHEMTTVYFLAGDRLFATHYCALGNQPTLALEPASTPQDVRMALSGGTGFDPARDQHAHGVHLDMRDASRLAVTWEFRQGANAPTFATLHLQRVAADEAAPAATPRAK